MIEQPPGMNFEQIRSIGKRCDFESDVWPRQTKLLSADRRSAGDDLDLLQHSFLSAEQMCQRLFIQTSVEAHTEITQKRFTPFAQRILTKLLPAIGRNYKVCPVTQKYARIYKFVLHLLSAHIDELPMRKFGNNQIMQEL